MLFDEPGFAPPTHRREPSVLIRLWAEYTGHCHCDVGGRALQRTLG